VDPSLTPICPKCGYDQSGEIATWKSNCPINGICNECGIPFHWADIFDPTRTRLRWYAEHAMSPWQILIRTPKTLLKLLLPHRFWRAIDITKDTCPKRLIAWVLLTMVIVHLLVSIPNGINAWNRSNWSGVTFSQYYQMYEGYALAEKIFDAIALPYYNAHPQAYSHKWSLFIERGRPNVWYDEFIQHISFQLGFLLLWLLVLFVIPTTKRIAKIRPAHVVRAAVLSTLMIFLSVEALRLLRTLYELSGFLIDIYTPVQHMVIPVVILWQVIFWSCAISIGWKVRPWLLLVTLGTAAALLGGYVFDTYIFLHRVV
jgi:hypothetical protein